MNGPYTSLGKEVLRDGQHFADVVSETDATDTAYALNILWDIRQGEAPEDDRQADFIADMIDPMVNGKPYTIAVDEKHTIRTEGDEYVCSCRRRWGFDEGHEHP